MRLVHSVGIVMAELVHDLGDAVVVVCGESIADGRFDPVVAYALVLLHDVFVGRFWISG